MHVINTIVNRQNVLCIDGIEILEFDYSNISDTDLIELFDIHASKITNLYPKNTYILLNVKNGPTSVRIIEACKKIMMRNIFDKSVAAIYNINSLSKLILKTINVIYKTNVAVFDTREDCILFLVTTAKKNAINRV